MNVYKEIKEIAKYVSKIKLLAESLSNQIDTEGIDWNSAQIVTLDEEDIEHFKNTRGETDDYFVDQWTGYCEDDFYGNLYFKTNVKGQYVKVHFEM